MTRQARLELQPKPSRLIAPILGCLGALAPLSIDMYLPGMPKIAADFRADEGAVQLSLMTFFAGLMLGQLFYGPLSDRTGRKPIIYVGLALFVAASLGCATAATAGQLAALRFAQGLGGSIGMVIGLAVVRDLYTGQAAARLMAMMMIVFSVAPILAPLLGTFIMSLLPWPALFIVLAAFGALCILLVTLALPETRMPELRAASRPLDAFKNYAHLVVSRRFMPYVATTVLAQAGFFAYLGGSAFAFISVYHLSPTAYSLLFAVNAIGLTAGAQISPRLMGHFSARAIVRTALSVYAVAAVALVVIEGLGSGGAITLAVLLFVVIAAMAFVLPLNSVLAMEAYGSISGTAAALMGTLQYGAGTLASLAMGLMANGTAQPMAVTIAISGLAGCLLAFVAIPNAQPAAPHA